MRPLGKRTENLTDLFLCRPRQPQYLNMLAQLGVAGVRIDAAKHINKWDLGNILQGLLTFLHAMNNKILSGAVSLCRFSYWCLSQVLSRTVRIPGRVQARESLTTAVSSHAEHDTAAFLWR